MAIYKPSLLDKFKDFVNGIRANWQEYEAHVADFEAHLAESVHQTGGVHGLEIESGTWTPNITFDSSDTGLTVTVAEGTYTKVGKIVTCNCSITLSNKGSAEGQARINGLPFPVAERITHPVARFINLIMPSGATTMCIVLTGDGGDLAVSGSELGFVGIRNVHFTNTTALRLAFQYTTV